MSLCLITGVAGFIGSTLAERLLSDGHQVRGVDCFTGYYPRPVKEGNLAGLLSHPRFSFSSTDLASGDLGGIVQDVEYVFHQAGQPGVLPSWGRLFDQYVTNNIVATQRLLEALKDRPIKRFMFASSSTIYGDSQELPVRETSLPRPIVPYGVTKLAAEHLVNLYHYNFGLPAVMLRYFSVYGPRQRPDMAFHKFIGAIARGETIQLYGDGEQTRDATYVGDIVQANVLAMRAGAAADGGVFNIGGGEQVDGQPHHPRDGKADRAQRSLGEGGPENRRSAAPVGGYDTGARDTGVRAERVTLRRLAAAGRMAAALIRARS